MIGKPNAKRMNSNMTMVSAPATPLSPSERKAVISEKDTLPKFKIRNTMKKSGHVEKKKIRNIRGKRGFEPVTLISINRVGQKIRVNI